MCNLMFYMLTNTQRLEITKHWPYFYCRVFETLSTKVLDECHHKDPNKAMMIVERKSPCWNDMTCLQIAASSNDQVHMFVLTYLPLVFQNYFA